MKELIIASYGATSLFQIVWEREGKEYRINKIKNIYFEIHEFPPFSYVYPFVLDKNS